jgi:hypothetical protein
MSVFTRGAPIIGLATVAPAAYTFVSRTTPLETATALIDRVARSLSLRDIWALKS